MRENAQKNGRGVASRMVLCEAESVRVHRRLSVSLSLSPCVGPSVLGVCAHRVGNKAAIKHM